MDTSRGVAQRPFGQLRVLGKPSVGFLRRAQRIGVSSALLLDAEGVAKAAGAAHTLRISSTWPQMHEAAGLRAFY